MLEKFIYAKEKSLFEEALNNGEVLDEAIVFIEDTKEIWNHGTYFDGSKVDLSNIEASIQNIIDSYATKAEIPTKLSQLENDANYIQDDVIPENGLYIYDTDGRFTLPENWNTTNNSKAVGVAILGENCRFVVAKENAKSSYVIWGGYGTDIASLTNYTSSTEAAKDFAGITNTQVIIDAIGQTNDGYRTGSAAQDCVDYIFPNGQAGYLGAAGEWQLARSYKDELNSALELIRGTKMPEGGYWTSTEYSSYGAWRQAFVSTSDLDGYGKDSIGYVRAFLSIEQPKPLKEKVSEIEQKYFKWSKLELLKNRGSLSLVQSAAASPDAIPYTLSINFEYPVESDITINYTYTDPDGGVRFNTTLVCEKGKTLASETLQGKEDVSEFDFIFDSFSPTEDDVYKYEITFG